MKRTATFYDYIYYRTCRHHLKAIRRDPSTKTPETSAKLELTILQSLNLSGLCLAIYYYVNLIFGWRCTIASNILMLMIFPCILIFFYLNDWRYASKKNEKKRWKAMYERWNMEPEKTRRLRGWAIALFYILSGVLWFYFFMKIPK